MPLLDVILLIGSVQGAFLAAFLFHRHRTLYATRFLVALLAVYSVVLSHLVLSDLGAYGAWPRVMILLSGLTLFSGPLHYLYARHLIDPTRRLRRKDVLHALPYLAYVLFMLPLLLLPGERIMVELFENAWYGFPWRFMLLNRALIALAFLYLGGTLLLLYRYVEHLREHFSSLHRVRLRWLRNITILVLLGWFSFLIENVLLYTEVISPEYFGVSGLLGTLMVYAMGYLGLTTTGVFSDPEVAASMRELAEQHADGEGIVRDARPTYGKSGLSEDKAEEIVTRLLRLMQSEKPYLDAELTLHRLAGMLDVSAHNLSEVINTRTGMNFFDFVNSYRVEQVKRDLLDPSKSQFTLLALAFDAGFASKTSFNAIFKKITGHTPSAWRASAAAEHIQSK